MAKEQLNPSDPQYKVNLLISAVRDTMSPDELDELSSETHEYLDAIIAKSLEEPEKFKPLLVDAIMSLYGRQFERFIQNPLTNGTLFVDGGELVSLNGVKLAVDDERSPYIASFSDYDFLTGPNKGKNFTSKDRPIHLPGN